MKKVHVLLGIFATIIIFVFSSCSIERLDDPIIIPLVDQEFELTMWQTLDEQGGNLEFQMETISSEDCENYSIVSALTSTLFSFRMTIFQILAPEECIEGEAPATGSETLGSLNNNSYSLRIELKDLVTNPGNLIVTDESYTIEMDAENGIGWTNYELRKVPSISLWGYLNYTDPLFAGQANVFLEDVAQISSPNTLTEGHYGYFDLSSLGTLSVKDSPEDQTVKPFLVKFDGDVSEITQLVEDFRSTAPEGLEVVVLDGVGNVW